MSEICWNRYEPARFRTADAWRGHRAKRESWSCRWQRENARELPIRHRKSRPDGMAGESWPEVCRAESTHAPQSRRNSVSRDTPGRVDNWRARSWKYTARILHPARMEYRRYKNGAAPGGRLRVPERSSRI